MAGKHKLWQAALAMLFLAPGAGFAESFFGWGWLFQPHDCPRSEYSPAHYWVPEWYRVRAVVHPTNLDQLPPGPCPPVAPTFESNRYRCRSIPSAPSSPYADPASYYGRSPTSLEGYVKDRWTKESPK
ncbi:MAG: hypothetical protein HY040_26795 [Planctomycetes bacterium]|nr:hypothetical protein [Planctomycetota bacterium]